MEPASEWPEQQGGNRAADGCVTAAMEPASEWPEQPSTRRWLAPMCCSRNGAGQ